MPRTFMRIAAALALLVPAAGVYAQAEAAKNYPTAARALGRAVHPGRIERHHRAT